MNSIHIKLHVHVLSLKFKCQLFNMKQHRKWNTRSNSMLYLWKTRQQLQRLNNFNQRSSIWNRPISLFWCNKLITKLYLRYVFIWAPIQRICVIVVWLKIILPLTKSLIGACPTIVEFSQFVSSRSWQLVRPLQLWPLFLQLHHTRFLWHQRLLLYLITNSHTLCQTTLTLTS